MFTSRSAPIRLPRPLRTAVTIAAAVGAAVVVSATSLPPGVGLLAGPDTPDTDDGDQDLVRGGPSGRAARRERRPARPR